MDGLEKKFELLQERKEFRVLTGRTSGPMVLVLGVFVRLYDKPVTNAYAKIMQQLCRQSCLL